MRPVFLRGLKPLLPNRHLRQTLDLSALSTAQHVSPHYKDVSNTNLPAELPPKYTTIEYTLARPAQVPHIFLLIVGPCLDEEDLKVLRDVLAAAVGTLPRTRLLGLLRSGRWCVPLTRFRT
ncbi:hypothetical protein M0805_006623 [Coniferiporia weirii]|nr:hypothetical protein M0805_006623 [Coniferiporia weirii]